MPTPSDLPVQAEFHPRLHTYLFWYGAFALIASIIGIVLLPIWVLGYGQWYARRYVELMECELTERHLRFRKGILFQTEHTIPLDNIQDLAFKEGPLLRYFDLSILKIETAGHSAQSGTDMTIYGITDGADFRNKALAQRDYLTDRRGTERPTRDDEEPPSAERIEQLLVEIRDAIRNLEAPRSDRSK